MDRQKLNKSLGIRLGLIMVLVIGCFVTAVNPTLARYRISDKGSMELAPRPLEQIYLGQMVKTAEDSDEEIFDDTQEGVWQMVDGKIRLEFAIANGKYVYEKNTQTGSDIPVEVAAQEDQKAVIRLMGDLSVWNGKEEFTLQLIGPSRVKVGETAVYTAVPQRIEQDTPLYRTFGDGWVFTFQDESGQELIWLLEGGELSVMEFELLMERENLNAVGQMKLEVTGDYTKK